jgi:hypothetical protein
MSDIKTTAPALSVETDGRSPGVPTVSEALSHNPTQLGEDPLYP